MGGCLCSLLGFHRIPKRSFVKQNKKGAKQQFSKMETGMMMVHNFKGIAQGKPTGDPFLPSISLLYAIILNRLHQLNTNAHRPMGTSRFIFEK